MCLCFPKTLNIYFLFLSDIKSIKKENNDVLCIVYRSFHTQFRNFIKHKLLHTLGILFYLQLAINLRSVVKHPTTSVLVKNIYNTEIYDLSFISHLFLYLKKNVFSCHISITQYFFSLKVCVHHILFAFKYINKSCIEKVIVCV